MDYEELCELLWRNWVDSSGTLPDWANLTRNLKLHKKFSPEPYLVHSEGVRPLVFLTTNPGGGMDFQEFDNIPMHVRRASYREIATCLPRFYKNNFPNDLPEAEGWEGVKAIDPSARTRICKMKKLGEMLSSEGVRQVEIIPLHSANLPNKKKAALHKSDPAWSNYLNSLKRYLADKDVFAFGATGVENEEPRDSDWLRLVLETISFEDPCKWVRPKAEVQNWLAVNRNRGYLRAINLMNSSNHLPADLNLLKPFLLP